MKRTYLKNVFKNINACASQPVDARSCSSGLQDDSGKENLLEQGLNEGRAKLVKTVQEKKDLPRLKLVTACGSGCDLSQAQLLGNSRGAGASCGLRRCRHPCLRTTRNSASSAERTLWVRPSVATLTEMKNVSVFHS